MSQTLYIESVTKKFGDFKAIDNVSIMIQKGEFFTLLGPSGCGKTTLLRMIAGFNSIEDGVIRFSKKTINNIPAHKRNIGMVFQNYAIFPHMSVFDNIAYGLKARKCTKEEIKDRVEEVLCLVRMEEYRDRQPQMLSGGQQQRVALARAIVIEPEVLLMDEPLSNLDAKLRVEMRSVIKKIQKRLGITTVYVTHDQEEALAISDRIAVLNKGTVQQIGTPYDIYTRPKNVFTANFIGTSNFIPCIIEAKNENTNSFGTIKLPDGKDLSLKLAKPYSGKAILSVRPEEACIVSEQEGVLTGTILFSTFLGDFINYEIVLQNEQIIQINEYMTDVSSVRETGQKVGIIVVQEKINIFDEFGKEALV